MWAGSAAYGFHRAYIGMKSPQFLIYTMKRGSAHTKLNIWTEPECAKQWYRLF